MDHLNLYSSHQNRIGLTVNEISIVSSQILTSQLRAGERTEGQLNEHTTLLTRILSNQSNLHDLFLNDSKNHENSPPRSFVRVKAYARHWNFPSCKPNCLCNCHCLRQLFPPPVLRNVFGALFIGYCGHPTRTIRCSEASCQAQSGFAFCVNYLFPSWFLRKALTVTLMAAAAEEVSVSLKIRTVVPLAAESIHLARSDDVAGLRHLFSRGVSLA